MRYGNDTFLGKQDTAVLFKKCGGSPGDADGACRGRLPRRRIGGRAGHIAVRGGSRRPACSCGAPAWHWRRPCKPPPQFGPRRHLPPRTPCRP
ncbi:hypothetical protein E2562_005541 [Oryza meyeriana var. granulata]|uniref:Uncharacterized protein n=1 Tax=Oryza meyeriana var. granulata TaxID=110450 RepID=A0A6G1F3X0_9ORYZ|nr:hypothetical protein E2562_005541 [Oryza meyeriana var. granulata]